MTRLIAFILPLLISFSAIAADTDYYKNLAKKAAQGETDSQYELGLEYLNGGNIKQDNSLAVKWIRLAAEKRYSDACFSLGQIYEYGNAVEKNDTEALKWYLIAAEENHIEARRTLGYAYMSGLIGVKKDLKTAASWLEKIAENYGNKSVMMDLAGIYDELKEYTKAEQLYRDSLEGYEPAIGSAAKLAYYYYNGLGVKKNLEEAYYYFSICKKTRVDVDKKINFNGKLKKDVMSKIETRANDFVSKYEMNMGRGG